MTCTCTRGIGSATTFRLDLGTLAHPVHVLLAKNEFLHLRAPRYHAFFVYGVEPSSDVHAERNHGFFEVVEWHALCEILVPLLNEVAND
jgi:hypothetical protein